MVSHDELLFALDSTDNVVMITDIGGKITFCNKAFERIYGYTQQETLGKPMSFLKSGYHDPDFYKNLWATISNGETWEGLFCNRTRDNRMIWEQTRISPIKDKDGAITGFIAVKDNVTYKRELEEQISQEQFMMNELFGNSPVGITICQPISDNGKVEDAMILKSNPIASSILNRLGLVGLSIRKLFPSIEFEQYKIGQMAQEKLSFESYLPNIEKYLSFKTFPLFDNRFCLIILDVTHYKLTIKALQESEQRYSSLVEDSPAMICRFNQEGKLVYANNLLGTTFGIKTANLMGLDFFKLFPNQVRKTIPHLTLNLSVQKPQIGFEQQVELNGHIKWQKWIIRGLFDKQNEIFEYQAIGMDFSEIKEAEFALIENRNKLNAVVSNDIIGIGLVDHQGKYKLVNSRLCEMLGCGEDELLRSASTDFTHPDDIELTELMMDRIFNKETPQYIIEKRYLRKDGSSFWASLYVSPIKDQEGNIKEVVGMVADIDEKKKIEMQIVENERKLKELNATKDKLFSIIAHDIKNPFHTILGLSSVLHEGLNDYSKEEIQLYVEKILEAGENTYKLLEDLLTWGRSQLGKLKTSPQNIHPSPIVAEVFQTYRNMASSKQIILNNNIPPTLVLHADYDMLKFMVRNLIHNGLKFTPDGGSVTCTATIDQEKQTAVLSVEDTGIGIKPEKLAVLFDINSFLSTMGTADEKGTGLGLSLTHEMVQLNGGSISAQSQPGKGTTFLIELPLGKETVGRNA